MTSQQRLGFLDLYFALILHHSQGFLLALGHSTGVFECLILPSVFSFFFFFFLFISFSLCLDGGKMEGRERRKDEKEREMLSA